MKEIEARMDSSMLPKIYVRVGGFFGKEIEVKPGGLNHGSGGKGPAPVKIVESKIVDVKTSTTALKPLRKRKSIKLCKICGDMVETLTCPTCGAEVR